MTFIIAAIVSIIGGIGAYLFRATLGAWIFAKPNPAQQAVDQQRKMDQAVIDTPDQAEAVRKLKDGKA